MVAPRAGAWPAAGRRRAAGGSEVEAEFKSRRGPEENGRGASAAGCPPGSSLIG